MPTQIIKSIKPAGGGNYTTLNAWAAARIGNIVTRDTVEIAEVYSGGNSVSSRLPLYVGDGWNTDATHRVIIRAAAGEAHHGVFSTSYAYGSVTGGGAFSSNVDFDLQGMQFSGDDYCASFWAASPKTATVDKCIFKQVGSSGNIAVYVNTSGVITFTSCVLLQNSTIGGLRFTLYSSTVGVINLYGCVLGGANAHYCISTAAGAGLVVNTQDCYFFGNQNVYTGNATFHKGDHDATWNADAVTPALRNIAHSVANFTNVTLGSEDYHLNHSSVLAWGGANQAGLTTDFEGDTRHSPPSIGADDWNFIVWTDGAVDGISVSDSPVGLATIPVTVSEGVVFQESPSGTATIIVTVYDVTVFGDVLSAIRSAIMAVYDGIKVADQHAGPTTGLITEVALGILPALAVVGHPAAISVQAAYPQIVIVIK